MEALRTPLRARALRPGLHAHSRDPRHVLRLWPVPLHTNHLLSVLSTVVPAAGVVGVGYGRGALEGKRLCVEWSTARARARAAVIGPARAAQCEREKLVKKASFPPKPSLRAQKP